MTKRVSASEVRTGIMLDWSAPAAGCRFPWFGFAGTPSPILQCPSPSSISVGPTLSRTSNICCRIASSAELVRAMPTEARGKRTKIVNSTHPVRSLGVRARARAPGRRDGTWYNEGQSSESLQILELYNTYCEEIDSWRPPFT